jgi:hypothetical protein
MSTSTAAAMLESLAAAIETNDQATIKRLVPSQFSESFLAELGTADRSAIASGFRTARVIEDSENEKIYEVHFIHPSGINATTTFGLGKNDVGEWVVIFW